MKVRKGFVSNSSSSSFICDLTGNTEGGWDASLSDVEMVECTNNHTFLYDGFPDVIEWIEDNSNYELPAELCPICNGSAKAELIERMKDQLSHLNLTVKDLVTHKIVK